MGVSGGGDVDGGNVVRGDDGVFVDYVADFGGEGVEAAVWLLDCSDAGGCGAVRWRGGGIGCVGVHFGVLACGRLMMVVSSAGEDKSLYVRMG